MSVEDHEAKIGGYDWAGKSDLDVARHINLALLLCDGISEQDAGFDTIIGLNDAGLSAIARVVGKVREAATALNQAPTPAGHGTEPCEPVTVQSKE